MMNKARLLSLFLLFLLPLSPAALSEDAPQTRSGILIIEGEEEEITLTRYESENGYAIWYDANLVTPIPKEETGVYDQFVCNTEAHGPVAYLSLFPFDGDEDTTLESAAAIAAAELALEGYALEERPVEDILQEYNTILLQGQSDIDAVRCYFVEANDRIYVLGAMTLPEYTEGLGTRLVHIISTFEPLPQGGSGK